MKFKLGILLNPDTAKLRLGWDKEEPFDEDSVNKYFSKCTEDVTFFWSNNIGPNPQVFLYPIEQTIEMTEATKEIYRPFI